MWGKIIRETKSDNILGFFLNLYPIEGMKDEVKENQNIRRRKKNIMI